MYEAEEERLDVEEQTTSRKRVPRRNMVAFLYPEVPYMVILAV